MSQETIIESLVGLRVLAESCGESAVAPIRMQLARYLLASCMPEGSDTGEITAVITVKDPKTKVIKHRLSGTGVMTREGYLFTDVEFV